MARITKAERDRLGLEWWDRAPILGAWSFDRLGVRTVYIDGSGRYWVEWYGEMIEVLYRGPHYLTVGAY